MHLKTGDVDDKFEVANSFMLEDRKWQVFEAANKL